MFASCLSYCSSMLLSLYLYNFPVICRSAKGRDERPRGGRRSVVRTLWIESEDL